MVAVCGFMPSSPTDTQATADAQRTQSPDKRRKDRILLVEDYLTNQQVATMHLTAAGYSVDLAQDGAAAVEKFAVGEYDLILMDLEMPVMDGYCATREIRRLESERKACHSSGIAVPIIATTAHALTGYEEKCRQAGMDDFMTKPLRRAQLLSKVRHWLSITSPGAHCELVDPLNAQTDNTPQQTAGTPIDLPKALEEFLGQKEVLNEILVSFQTKVQEQISLIEQALNTEDAETVRKEAHAIKGGAANLTADPLAAVALELENIGKSGRLEKGASTLHALENELNRLSTFLQQDT